MDRLYSLVDIGANLTHPAYSGADVDDVINRAKACGIEKIMVTGSSVKVSGEARRLTQLYPQYIYFTAGVHPHDAKEFTDETVGELRELASSSSCVAVGECGLDFNRNFSPQPDQLRAFERQVELACELQKPLFVHEREASDALIQILGKHKGKLPPTVIHCFTGTIDEAKLYLDMGLYIGLTGFLWKDRLDNGVQAGLNQGIFPLDRILIETDAPFMYPNVTGKKFPKEILDKLTPSSVAWLKSYCSFKRNEPCALPVICEMIAAFMGKDPSEVAEATTKNAHTVYGLTG